MYAKTTIILTTLVIMALSCVALSVAADPNDFYAHRPLGQKSSTIHYAANPDLFLTTEYAKYLNQDQRDCVRDRTVFDKLCLGITPDGVLAVHGIPADRRFSQTSYGTREMWVYRDPSGKPVYIFFEDGKMSSWEK